jgi:bacteriorhodopsin
LKRILNHNKLVHSLLRLFFGVFNIFFQIFQTNVQLIFKEIVKFSIDNGGIRKANRVGKNQNSFKMEHLQIASDNYVAFTFFIGTMAMMAASVFFFFELNNTAKAWRTSILVSGLITFIAAVHYYYMRGYNLETGDSPTFFRYVDWILTVPLMCVEFYLITKKAGAKVALLWKLIFASLVMLVTGYFGETIDRDNSVLWGVISGAAYFYIAYLVWFGEVAKLAQNAGPNVAKATRILAWFVLVGWAIYPLGYILGTPGGLFGMKLVADPAAATHAMDIVYNIADAINKIGFGLVIYALSRNEE